LGHRKDGVSFPGHYNETLKVFVITLQGFGWLAFLTATTILGFWLRKHPGKTNAERACKILHFIFWAGIVPPAALGVVHPGLQGYEGELGLPPLPQHTILLVVGVLGVMIGVSLFVVSNGALRFSGKGAPAFWLTKRLVTGGIYKRTRNPMSLGLYFGSVGIGLLIGSTYCSLGAMLVVIPVHIFYLKYFEEYELELRMGQPYLEYKQRAPFLFPRWTSQLS
jgi:protein-S-isoprenylcysteine O-methyltransferase Ste14